MISKITIDKVFEAARVEEVIGDFVQLKKSGANYKGLSPFTDERTPSFTISPAKQIWKDFSSGKGGNTVAFLMEHEHFSYPEAIRYLAKKYQIEVIETQQNEEEKQQAGERESLYLVSAYAQSYFEDILWKEEEGMAIGLSYFKERGFTEATIKKFGLGYALNQWEAFTQAALNEGYKLEFLEKAGLTIVKGDRRFDRFKGRVLFPIHSLSGRVQGFGGRILTSDKKAAKYVNSPESEIYHKSKILYGIYQGRQAISKEDNCYLVEGYTDVIQFWQRGITNVVASGGTALTPQQIRLVNRLTKNITVLYDGDEAGQRASFRGIDLILEAGMNVKICSFPDGEDPDSFALKNELPELLEYLKENTKDFIQYKATTLAEASKNDPIKKAETVTDIIQSIARIPNAIQREIYIRECSRLMAISEEVLFSTLAQFRAREKAEALKRNKNKPHEVMQVVKTDTGIEKVDPLYELERKIIQILLLYGNEKKTFNDLILKENEKGELQLEEVLREARVFEKIYMELQLDEIKFTNTQFKDIYQKLLEYYCEPGKGEISEFSNRLEPELAGEITSILMNEERHALHDWERKNIFVKSKEQGIVQLLEQTVLSLRSFLIEKRINFLQQGLWGYDPGNPSEERKIEADLNSHEILEEITQFERLKKLLYKKMDRVLP